MLVTGFDALLDQHRPVRLLKAALVSGNLPHAYLFTGPEGVGKKSAAQTMAMALNCRGRRGGSTDKAGAALTTGAEGPENASIFCGCCRACKKIQSACHPDVYWITPAGSHTKVDQIRELGRQLSLRPREARIRLAIMESAHTLNPEAGNTLLKILEEPPAQTLFILLARQTSELLPTIVSRCRHIRFNPISTASLQRYLTAHYHVAGDEAEIIAAMAGGSMSRAAAMTQKDWLRYRRWIIETLIEIETQSVNCRLAFAEALARDTERLPTALEIMKSWYRDLAVYAHLPARLINRDLSNKIGEQAVHCSSRRLLAILKAIDETAYRIETNSNARLAIDQLVIALSNMETLKNGKDNRCPV